MSDVVLVADGGEITVGRRVAGFVWGKWVTQVLDGEQPKADDPRLVQGFVHKPTNMPQGRFDIRGVRADITQVMAVAPDGGIDYDRGSSDAEQVLDAAETRSDGEVFFESDITVIGLGPHVPGLDFDIDSIVDVQLCQRRIAAPVTAVDMTAENGVLGWRVHTGGQPIVDSMRLNSSNTQILGVLAQERRESDARLAAVDSKADGAVSDARAAQSTATQADENAKAAQGSADQAQETADEAIKKWRSQKDELDNLQSSQIKANRTFSEGIKELAEKVDVRSTGMVFLKSDEKRWSKTHGIGVRMPGYGRWLMVVAVPDFRGSCVIDVYYSNGTVVPYHVKSSDFELVYSWRNWEYRESYNGADFDPLLDSPGGSLKVFWLKVDIGNVSAARVMSDKVEWST